MKRTDFDFANDIWGVKLQHISDGRIIVKIHKGDDEFYQDAPALEFEAAWTTDIINLMRCVDRSLPKTHPRRGRRSKSARRGNQESRS
jgi:hypothetical protein